MPKFINTDLDVVQAFLIAAGISGILLAIGGVVLLIVWIASMGVVGGIIAAVVGVFLFLWFIAYMSLALG